MFSTTSIAKLLQARLAFAGRGLQIEQLVRHQPAYVEPYGLPRREFLQAGMNQVLQRAGRSRLVIIEDTTVNIPSLARATDLEEYPGQQTKEWFTSTTHSRVVEEIEKAGGDFSAVVRSDVALHVPGMDGVLIFDGETRGTISCELFDHQPNPLYPWLGREDFSLWFLPDGAEVVLANMSYEASLRHDFRVKAFGCLLDRLEEYAAVVKLQAPAIRNSPSFVVDQFGLLPLFEKTLIVVTGPIGAGKSTIGHFFALHHGARHIEGSSAIKAVGKKLGLAELSGFELADEVFSVAGPTAVEERYVWPYFEQLGGPIVYTGARTLEGIQYLAKMCHDAAINFQLFHISSVENSRAARVVERAREAGATSHEAFEIASRRDVSYGAARYGHLIADRHIHNNSSVARLTGQLKRFWADLIHGATGAPMGSRDSLLRELTSESTNLRRLEQHWPDLVNREGGRVSLSSRGQALLDLACRFGPLGAGS